jgi:heparan-alpha-glucosaminide N-acetyltransferase
MKSLASSRLLSIDILRALTMLLMIFVNDLWTLTDIPGWLEHKAATEDGMGLADVVFPAFLFIVGLSIPLAIRARFKKGDSKLLILRHIIERTLALLIMGVLMVNLEHINPAGLLFSSELWQILMALGFFLIWNAYGDRLAGKFSPWILKGLGWALLIFLSITYSGRGNGAGEWMHLYWWGILGLIGWGYLAGALAYLLLGDRPGWITFVFFVFMLLNINEFITPFSFRVKLVVSASNHALVLAGVVVTSVMIRLREQERIKLLVPFLLLFSALLFLFGFITRPLWGISKILATPSWTAICAAITALVFMLMYLLTDRLSLYRWAGIIKAAGTSTLTCYLVPYFVYALRDLSGLTLPSVLTTGFAGILKSLVFAILIIQITGILERLKIRLKI